MTDDATSARWEFETFDVRLVERFLRARPPDARPAASAPTRRRLRYSYLDTARRRLLASGFALRVLRRGRRTFAELIPIREARPGVSFTEEAASSAPSAFAQADGPVGSRVRLLCGRPQLRELIELDVAESRRTLRDGEVELGTLVLENVALPLDDERRRLRIERVRIESAPGVEADRLASFVAELRGAVELFDVRAGTFETALAARGVAVPDASVIAPDAITPTSTLGDVAFAVLRRQFAAYLASEPGTRLGDDPEDLHDMRVATRRMRAAMSLFRAVLPPRAAALRDELKWVAGALGEVRDLDVQSEQFASWAADDARLAAVGLNPQERDDARRRMLDVLDSARCRRFVRAFGSMLRHGPLRTNAVASAPAVALAPDIVIDKRRKVRRAAKRLAPESSPQAYHALRIRCKRLRYALEFLKDVYGAPATDLAERIAAVQDILGRHQDAYVAMGRVSAMFARADTPAAETAFAMGVVAERSAQTAARLRERFPRVYARTTGKPWRRLKRTMEKMRPTAAASSTDAPIAPTPVVDPPPAVETAEFAGPMTPPA